MTNMADSTLEKRAIGAQRDRQRTLNSFPSVHPKAGIRIGDKRPSAKGHISQKNLHRPAQRKQRQACFGEYLQFRDVKAVWKTGKTNPFGCSGANFLLPGTRSGGTYAHRERVFSWSARLYPEADGDG